MKNNFYCYSGFCIILSMQFHFSLLLCLLIFAGCGQADGIQPMPAPPDTTYTVILRGGMLYDGRGNQPVAADIGFVNDRIIGIGDLSPFQAPVERDVTGLAVAPGFIDIHSHAASSSLRNSGIYRSPKAENYIRQGVTTAIAGQDGNSPFPIGEYLDQLESRDLGMNIGLFVGHGTLRAWVMGNVDRAPSANEMTRMQDYLKAAFEQGAMGLSSGLEYTPGAYARTDELVKLAQVAAPFQAGHLSHIRDEGGKLLDSVAETIRIGEEGGIPTQVTHHKVIGKTRWGNSTASLQLIDEARARGVDAASDIYPYTASSTGISILLPAWAKEGSGAQRRARLRDPEQRIFIRNDVISHINNERGGDPSTIVIANCTWNRSLNGKSFADILTERNEDVSVENAADLAMEIVEKGGCMGVFHSMSEEDVQRIMQHPMTMIASDGGIPAFGAGVPHPRNYGSFARVLARYVRDLEVISLEEAIRKMTSLPAQRLRLEDRGTLEAGSIADVAVFNPQTIQDHATFTDPHQYATGMHHVFVRGQAVLMDSVMTGNLPGVVLRKPSGVQ